MARLKPRPFKAKARLLRVGPFTGSISTMWAGPAIELNVDGSHTF
jgi:hypothetical protein